MPDRLSGLERLFFQVPFPVGSLLPALLRQPLKFLF